MSLKNIAFSAIAVMVISIMSLGTVVKTVEAADDHTIFLGHMAEGTCSVAIAVNGASVSSPADGTQASRLCALVVLGKNVDANGADDIYGNGDDPVLTVAAGVPVVFTVSLGVVSTGTAKTTTVISATSGLASTNYRGGGNKATTDTAIASYSAGNAVDTVTITLTAPTGNTASKLQFNAPTELAIGATQTLSSPNYQSPKTSTNISLQALDTTGLGVDGETLLITADRGNVILGFNQACADQKAVTATTAQAATSVGGEVKAGTVQLTLCADQDDAPGKMTATAQNISTTMANATASISNAGRPAKITATATGNAVTAKVMDSGDNPVADGTPIRFTMSSNAGAVSTSCTTSTNGEAASVVALIAATGTVIVSADWNETGAASTCAAAGTKQLAASVTVPGGSTTGGGTTPSAGTITSGSIPAAGGFGLIVYGGPVNALVTASGCPAASAAFWATVNGNFVTYVPGTTITAVNADFMAAFPNGIPAGTPLIGKCK